MFSVIGRPRLSVCMEDVEYLRELRFSWTSIAKILDVSRSTLYRRLDEEGISRQLTYTDISNLELDAVVRDIKHAHPNSGERLLIGHLAQQNIIVPRFRVRASIHRVDPINTALRRSITIRRRVYYSEGPNAVWHVDGHHKLIKWRFVIHGGIDGFSRLIVYLKCSDNNRAATVLQCFEDAVDKFGLPSKIRTDLRGENVDIWRYLIEQHHDDTVVITGSSTHNERIERLWRDVHRCVGVLYADLFRELEEEGKLDSLNEVDIFCLHYVFKARINSTLNSFVESWNNHSISTERSQSPNQLYILGMVNRGTVPTRPNLTTATSQSTPGHLDPVEVPRVGYLPCASLNMQLALIDPLGPTSDFGADVYFRVVTVVGSHLEQGCEDCQ